VEGKCREKIAEKAWKGVLRMVWAEVGEKLGL
jgi:hypothetical protein